MAPSAQKLLTVRIDEEFHQKLRVATVAHDTTVAEIVRTALDAWLKANPASKGKKAAAPKVVKAKPAKAAKPAKPAKSDKKAGKKKKK